MPRQRAYQKSEEQKHSIKVGKAVFKNFIENNLIGKTVICQDGLTFMVTKDDLEYIHISPQTMYFYYSDGVLEKGRIIVDIK